MKANEKFNIDITQAEAPDFEMELSQEEKDRLTQNVLEKIALIQETEKPKEQKVIRFHRRVISLVAAAILLIASTTAIATITTRRFIEEPVKVEESKFTEASQKNKDNKKKTTDASQSTNSVVIENLKKEKQYVKLNYDNLEGYNVINTQDGWYNFEHEDSTLNFDCQVIYGDTEWSRDYVIEAGIERSTEFVPVYQWIYLGNKKALYVEYEKDWLYTQQLFVRYGKSKYTLSILTPETISKKQLLELGEKITLETCSKYEGSAAVKLTDYLENYCPDKMKGEVPQSQIVDINSMATQQQFVIDNNCQVTVESVTAYDNISQFTSSVQNETEESTNPAENQELTGMYSSLVNNSSLFTNPDGSLTMYKRSYLYQGDGINTPVEKIAYEQIQQKFYLIQLRIKNTGGEKINGLNISYPLMYINETSEEYFVDATDYNRPSAIEQCQEGNLPQFCSQKNGVLPLEAEQEQTVQLGYFVDSDLAEKMFIDVNGMKIDIRQE